MREVHSGPDDQGFLAANTLICNDGHCVYGRVSFLPHARMTAHPSRPNELLMLFTQGVRIIQYPNELDLERDAVILEFEGIIPTNE